MNWIKCSDRLPKDKEEVLVFDRDVVCYARCHHGPSGAIYLHIFDHRIYGDCDLVIEIEKDIYWMPLPAFPNSIEEIGEKLSEEFEREQADSFLTKIHASKILTDQEILTLVKLMPFLSISVSGIVFSEAIQRVLKK
jgi:hypothetical protein